MAMPNLKVSFKDSPLGFVNGLNSIFFIQTIKIFIDEKQN